MQSKISTKKTKKSGDLKYNTRSRPKGGENPSDVKAMMASNSEAYVASLLDPFHVREVRVPESAPFPSACGSHEYRYTPAAVADVALPARVWAGAYFGVDYTVNGVWYGAITGLNAGVEAWATQAHPRNAAFQTNFQGIRRVSMGVKVCNVSTAVERGGALYISYTPLRPAGGLIANLRGAAETEVYDAARLTAEGLTSVYIPITSTPLNITGDTISLPGCAYMNPAAVHAAGTTIYDMNIVIWLEGTDQQDLSLIFEQVDNYEALPFSQTEFMFDRKAVMASEDAKASAMVAAVPPSSAVSTTTPTVWKTLKNAASNVGQFAVKQIESMALGALMSLPSLLMDDDYVNHVLSVQARRADLSPINNKRVRGMKRVEFLRELLDDFEDIKTGEPVDIPTRPPATRRS